jgi:putative FmdB family regulatory protein
VPTYAYRCTGCSHEFEIFQKFSDSPLTECPECGQEIRRVFHPVGIVFKGSGWYINDSRKDKGSGDATAKVKSGDSAESTDTAKPAATATSTEKAPAATATASKEAAD